MNKVFFIILLFFSTSVFAETYICGFESDGETKTQKFERFGFDYFKKENGSLENIIFENELFIHIHTIVEPGTWAVLRIIDKRNNKYTQSLVGNDLPPNKITGICVKN